MAARFWVLGTGTWDASDTTHWAATSGAGSGGASVPIAGDTVTFDGSSGGGTVTVNHASLNVSTLTMSAFTGTLDFATNNNNITITSAFTNNGSGTRTLNMGNGTWTLSGTSGQLWNVGGSNLTFNCNNSTLVFNGTSTSGGRTIILGTYTYNDITISNSSLNDYVILATNGGNPTIDNLTLTNVRQFQISGGSTWTITGTFSWTGPTSTSPGILNSISSTGTISVGGSNTLDWVFPVNVVKAGAGTLAFTNSYNFNSTVTSLSNPSTGAVGVIGG
jgi:hypothetical protein